MKLRKNLDSIIRSLESTSSDCKSSAKMRESKVIEEEMKLVVCGFLLSVFHSNLNRQTNDE
jgi:hypothetical protein